MWTESAPSREPGTCPAQDPLRPPVTDGHGPEGAFWRHTPVQREEKLLGRGAETPGPSTRADATQGTTPYRGCCHRLCVPSGRARAGETERHSCGPGACRVATSAGSNFKSQRRRPLLTLAFEALKPGTDLPSPAPTVLDGGIVSQPEAVLSALRNLRVGAAAPRGAPGGPGGLAAAPPSAPAGRRALPCYGDGSSPSTSRTSRGRPPAPLLQLPRLSPSRTGESEGLAPERDAAGRTSIRTTKTSQAVCFPIHRVFAEVAPLISGRNVPFALPTGPTGTGGLACGPSGVPRAFLRAGSFAAFD